MALPKLTRSDNDDLVDVRVILAKVLDVPKRSIEIVSVKRQAAGANPLRERLAFDEFHRQKELAVRLVDRVNRDDVQVVEGGDGVVPETSAGREAQRWGDYVRARSSWGEGCCANFLSLETGLLHPVFDPKSLDAGKFPFVGCDQR